MFALPVMSAPSAISARPLCLLRPLPTRDVIPAQAGTYATRSRRNGRCFLVQAATAQSGAASSSPSMVAWIAAFAAMTQVGGSQATCSGQGGRCFRAQAATAPRGVAPSIPPIVAWIAAFAAMTQVERDPRHVQRAGRPLLPGASGDRAERGGIVEPLDGGVDRGLRRDDASWEDLRNVQPAEQSLLPGASGNRAEQAGLVEPADGGVDRGLRRDDGKIGWRHSGVCYAYMKHRTQIAVSVATISEQLDRCSRAFTYLPASSTESSTSA